MDSPERTTDMSPDEELSWLRKRRRADEATIEALTSALAKLQRAARALRQENVELRRELGNRTSPGAAGGRPAARGRARSGRTATRRYRSETAP